MKKFFIFGLLFLCLNGLYAVPFEPTFGWCDAPIFRQWCVEHGGESWARLVERFAQNELKEVRSVRRLIGEKERDAFIRFIVRDCYERQDQAIRLLWLLQGVYPSEVQRR